MRCSNFRVLALSFAGMVLPLPAGPAQAEGPRSPVGANAELTVAPATGALSWTLPVGVVPGDIPIPVVYRYQASLTGFRTEEALPESNLRFRGIWASLHFGFLAPPGQDPDAGPAEEGIQVLEDGQEFRDRDWRGQVADGLPAAFGLKAPAEGYATEGSRTYGLYTAAMGDLGTWAAQVGACSPATRFKVILDRNRARIFAYQKALQAYVPVLWLDRFGHWVGFRWQQESKAGFATFTVQASNPSGTGIQVTWAAQEPGEEVVDLLRADFIGMPSPSLLVRGYPGRPGQLPEGVEAGSAWPARLAVGGPVGRPIQVQLGPPANLPMPAFAASLPQAPAMPAASVREWRFAYCDAQGTEVSGLQDPWGLQATFSYETCRFSGGSLVRGVTELRRLDPVTAVSHTQTWNRTLPGEAGGAWTVRHHADYSEGEPTEDRSSLSTFVDTGAGPGRAFLKSLEIQGTAGTTRWTVYHPGEQTDHAPIVPERTQVTASGQPSVILRNSHDHRGALTAEALEVDGEVVQTRSLTYAGSGQGTGSDLPTAVTVQRQGLPAIQERWEYASQGLVNRHTTRAGGQDRGHAYSYDRDGRLARIATVASWTNDPGLTWRFTPGPLGATALARSGTRLNQPLAESWEYTPTGQVAQHRDAKGNITDTTYDLWGRPLTVAVSGSPTLSYAYPDERTRTWRQGKLIGSEQIDGFGRLCTNLRADGVTESHGYDRLGRLVVTRESSGTVTRSVREVVYDALDRLIQERRALGLARSHNYSASGLHQVVTSTSADGGVASRTLDPWGQCVVSSNLTGTTSTRYNEFGQVMEIVHEEPGGRSQSRRFHYVQLGRLLRREEPETGTTRFGRFNANGQPGKEIDANGRVTRMTHDALGRMLTRSSGRLSVANLYKGPFLIGRNSSEGISQEFSHAAPGARMDRESLTIDGVKRTLRYGHHPDGTLAQVAYPSGRTVEYEYDQHQRVARISQDGSALARVEHDGWGNLTALIFASGASSHWTLDESGRRWQTWKLVHGTGSEDRSYCYDPADHLLQAGEWALEHDALGRLTRASGFELDTRHGYDGFGNSISHQVSGFHANGLNAFIMEPLADNRIPRVQANGGRTGWQVEANGEAAQIGTEVAGRDALSLGWDPLGRLAIVADSRAGAEQRFRYAPSGLRVTLTDSRDGKSSRQFLYSDDGLLLGEYLGDGRWQRDVIYLGSRAIAEVEAAGVRELHPDHLGTPRVITTGDSAEVVGRQVFGPYGEHLENTPHSCGYQPLTGYTGHQHSDASGLIYMRGRFFSPAWHRFLNSDLGVDPLSVNQFGYTGGSPFHATDPSGFMFRPGAGAGAGIPRYPDGVINGGGATVPVIDRAPAPLPTVPLRAPHGPVFPSFPGSQPGAPFLPGPVPAGAGQTWTPPRSSGSQIPVPATTAAVPIPKADPITPDRLRLKPEVEPAGGPARSADQLIAQGKYAEAARAMKAQAAQTSRPAQAAQSTQAQTSGPFIAPNPTSIADKPFYGDHQCVALVLAVCPRIPQRTSLWKPGCRVQGNNIAPGTAIATFGPDGDYQNISGQSHAALFLSQNDNGIMVVDQWSTQLPHRRLIPWTSRDGRKSNEGSAYYVIERK